MFSSCNPAPFDDPKPDMNELLSIMTERINGEEALKQLEPTEYERKTTHLRRFLARKAYDIDQALGMWKEWVTWRHENMVDKIEDSEIEYENQEGVLIWRGQNKEKMRCCVITGRALDPINRAGTYRSFKRFMIKTLEDGLKAVDDDEQDKVCFIYDRRGLEFKHIDPNLFNFCKKVAEEMRDWYNDRVGAIYILHMNWFFWLLYTVIVSPALSLFSSDFQKKFIVVDTPADLLKYFNEEDLLLSRLEASDGGAEGAEGAGDGDNHSSAATAASSRRTSVADGVGEGDGNEAPVTTEQALPVDAAADGMRR